jgi:hypothetical protein
MKLKNIFIVVVLLWIGTANSQIKIQFNTFRDGDESTRFTLKNINYTKITSLNMLSRVGISNTWNEDFNAINSKNKYYWAKDAYRYESYKRMFNNLYKHDRYGREFLTNLNEGIINQIYLKNATFNY